MSAIYAGEHERGRMYTFSGSHGNIAGNPGGDGACVPPSTIWKNGKELRETPIELSPRFLLIKEYILKPNLPVTNANKFDFAFVYVNDYNIANIITISVAIFVVVFVVVVVVVDGGVVDGDGVVVVVFISIMYPLHFFGAISARA